MIQELPDIQTGFRKIREIRAQIANICWITGTPCRSHGKESDCNVGNPGLIPVQEDPLEKGMATHASILAWRIETAREFLKNIYFYFIDHTKAFDCVGHNKLWKILKEMGIPDHLTCLLRNLYAGQEATVRSRGRTTDWFKIGKGVCQGCILSLCLFNLYAEYIKQNAGLDESQVGIKIARKNINNFIYADDITLMAESKGEWKSLLMKVQEESKQASLKLNIQKKKQKQKQHPVLSIHVK